MRYLLDVNVLVAWGWADHAEHERTASWIAHLKRENGARICTSAIPQLGFVRVSTQRALGRVRVADATKVLAGLISSIAKIHVFLPDDQPSVVSLPDWCQSASQTTDAHLIQLAQRHDLTLATLDSRVPGAFLIPPHSDRDDRAGKN